ncbi:MAG: proline--tRNA ligase [Bdellovibrionaceae bacterium]|nr:proline--tRNA ligase [Pseudobdellovibrionaceae bacterium]
MQQHHIKWSSRFHKTFREAPGDADIPSQQLLIRAGLIKKLAPGIYTYGTLALRAIRKFENIIREELEASGCQEILMPMVQPLTLWEETGRAGIPELLKFKNRNDHDFCLGATHEEAVTDYIRNDISSYRDLPQCLYQIQTKYRDEIRPRFGLMRGREFIMKDAYSFDVDSETAKASYANLRKAYIRIFDRLGLEYRVVQADAGAIGGSLTEEFQVLAQVGEDLLLVSEASDFAANREICPRVYQATEGVPVFATIEEFATPNVRTIEALSKFMDIPEEHLVKTLFLKADGKSYAILLRGCDELNPIKLKNVFGFKEEPVMLSDEEVLALTGARPGSCGPQGLDVKVFADHYLKDFKSYIVGANKDGYHVKGLKPDVDFKIAKFVDIAFAKAGDPSPDGQGALTEVRGIEVGHIFYLGTKYSAAMKATYQDESGKLKPIEMGCYGIGVGRTVQAAIEQSHDKDGIIWPKSIAPYDLHLCILDPKEADVMEYTQKLLGELGALGLSAFVDDRNERPGVKFKDADLMGLPVRVVIGKRGFDQGEVEVVVRSTQAKSSAPLASAAATIKTSWENCK